MARPKGSTNKLKVEADKITEVEETVEVVEESKVAEEAKDGNVEIMAMLKQMQEELSGLKQENDKLKTENSELARTQIYDTKVLSSDKVKLVHLLQGGTSLITSVGKSIRFENVFEERWVKKEDLEDLVFGHNYNNIFQKMGVYICDKEIVDDMMLTKYYDKYKINDNLYEDMLEMTYAELTDRLSKLPEDLAYAFKMYVVDQHNEDGLEIKNDVTTAVNAFFKTNIFDLFK